VQLILEPSVLSAPLSDNLLSYWVALSCIPSIGPGLFFKILNAYPTVSDIFKLSTTALESLGLSKEACSAIQNPDWRTVDAALQLNTQQEYSIITFQDSRYPARLREIHTPPPLLYCRGNVAVLQNPQLAIVGSRNPTTTGVENAKQFAYHLAKQGLTITSGLALGIDAASHRGALLASDKKLTSIASETQDANIGTTVAVTATGWTSVYPGRHSGLAVEIIDKGGIIITEFPPGTRPLRQNFPQRNRLLSGLSVGVLVVEAALRSGSLITTRYALEQGREVFAIPGSIHNPLARGCHRLIRQGAKLVENASDVWEELQGILPSTATMTHFSKETPGIEHKLGHQRPDCDKNQAPITKKHAKLLTYLGHEVTTMEELICRSGLTSSLISSMLLGLELNGLVIVVPGGYMRVARV
jgi:DNA processing protein